ncbi:unnamed protein product [Dicrocoelium dendriticum]|nr:unnamed protein product [Dicrocoelium dendriticum]
MIQTSATPARSVLLSAGDPLLKWNAQPCSTYFVLLQSLDMQRNCASDWTDPMMISTPAPALEPPPNVSVTNVGPGRQLVMWAPLGPPTTCPHVYRIQIQSTGSNTTYFTVSSDKFGRSDLDIG